MECKETKTWLHGYLDGELDLARMMEIGQAVHDRYVRVLRELDQHRMQERARDDGSLTLRNDRDPFAVRAVQGVDLPGHEPGRTHQRPKGVGRGVRERTLLSIEPSIREAPRDEPVGKRERRVRIPSRAVPRRDQHGVPRTVDR